MKVDPIIAVEDVEKSSSWYQSVFGCRSIHGGSEFDVLVSKKDEVILCLHKWGEHDHPTMQETGNNTGNGLILYFRVDDIEQIRRNLKTMEYQVDKEMKLSLNSNRLEFSMRDPDGYYLTIADHHEYDG